MVAALALGGLAPLTHAQAQAPNAIVVFAALQTIRENHYEEQDPVKLLGAAVDGMRRALTRAGVTPNLPDIPAANENRARAEFQNRFELAVQQGQGKVSADQLQYAAAQGMAAHIDDSHTGFIPPERRAEDLRRQRNEASYSGIGISMLTREGRFYIQHVFSGTPAQRSGLRNWDRIVSIDGASTQGMTSEDVSGKIRGPQGQTVSILVQRPGQTNPVTISITREPIVIPTIEHQMLDNRIGYIRFSQFTQQAGPRIRQALEELQQQGMRALVLDLRGNSGGLLNELNRIAEYFLPAGTNIYTMETRREGKRTFVSRAAPIVDRSIPMTVLIDDGSASAAELLAAALQENRRATLVGRTSAGAVLVSVVFPLPQGAGMSVSIARLITGAGAVLEGNGIKPDVTVDLATEDIERGVDTQLARALQATTQRLAGR
jgi:carboxyl-terminal processing protease